MSGRVWAVWYVDEGGTEMNSIREWIIQFMVGRNRSGKVLPSKSLSRRLVRPKPKIRSSELPARKPNERNPFLTADGNLKPGIIQPKPPPLSQDEIIELIKMADEMVMFLNGFRKGCRRFDSAT